jgi:hypothetical protein
MTAPPPARTLDFGASATASLLVKMTITFGISERRDQMITFSLFEKLMKDEMPQNQEELDAVLLVDDKKEHLINNLASSWIYEKLVTNVRLSDKITDRKMEYSHLYSTSSLLPHWDTIHATGSTLVSSSSRIQQPARFSAAPSASSSSNMLVTNYKPPRLTDKQSDTQVYLTLVALEHASARLDFGQMTSITSDHTDLSVHWNSTVIRSQSTHTPEMDTILQFLSSVKTLYDPSHKHPDIEKQLKKIKHKPGELPRDYLIRFQKKLIELEDAAVISKTQSDYHIISSVTEQVKQATKGMDSGFKQQLKIQMHARQVTRFNSWSQYLEFVTSVQRAVQSDDDASSNDGGKDITSKKKVRSLVTTGGKRTPKEVFPDSLLTSTSEWPAERDRCVFNHNHVECPFGEKCTRKHANTTKSSSSSSAATDGSNSPKIRAINAMMRKLSAEKGRLAAQEDEESVSSIDSEVSYDPHKSPPLPPTERARSRGSASITSADDLGSLKRLLGLDN